MKKNVLVKIGERTETRERIIPAVYGGDGKLITPETVEQYTVTVPVMEASNVEMTAEEIAAQKEALKPVDEPTQEDKIEAQVMYTALMTETLLDMEV